MSRLIIYHSRLEKLQNMSEERRNHSSGLCIIIYTNWNCTSSQGGMPIYKILRKVFRRIAGMHEKYS